MVKSEEGLLKFNDNPTDEDICDAEKNNYIIVAHIKGQAPPLSIIQSKEVESKWMEECSITTRSSYVVLFVVDESLSDEEYNKRVKDNKNRLIEYYKKADIIKPWYPSAGFKFGKLKLKLKGEDKC